MSNMHIASSKTTTYGQLTYKEIKKTNEEKLKAAIDRNDVEYVVNNVICADYNQNGLCILLENLCIKNKPDIIKAIIRDTNYFSPEVLAISIVKMLDSGESESVDDVNLLLKNIPYQKAQGLPEIAGRIVEEGEIKLVNECFVVEKLAELGSITTSETIDDDAKLMSITDPMELKEFLNSDIKCSAEALSLLLEKADLKNDKNTIEWMLGTKCYTRKMVADIIVMAFNNIDESDFFYQLMQNPYFEKNKEILALVIVEILDKGAEFAEVVDDILKLKTIHSHTQELLKTALSIALQRVELGGEHQLNHPDMIIDRLNSLMDDATFTRTFLVPPRPSIEQLSQDQIKDTSYNKLIDAIKQNNFTYFERKIYQFIQNSNHHQRNFLLELACEMRKPEFISAIVNSARDFYSNDNLAGFILEMSIKNHDVVVRELLNSNTLMEQHELLGTAMEQAQIRANPDNADTLKNPTLLINKLDNLIKNLELITLMTYDLDRLINRLNSADSSYSQDELHRMLENALRLGDPVIEKLLATKSYTPDIVTEMMKNALGYEQPGVVLSLLKFKFPEQNEFIKLMENLLEMNQGHFVDELMKIKFPEPGKLADFIEDLLKNNRGDFVDELLKSRFARPDELVHFIMNLLDNNRASSVINLMKTNLLNKDEIASLLNEVKKLADKKNNEIVFHKVTELILILVPPKSTEQ